ncbi:hypothetical protein KDH_44530 [Dictyobacter sp. S3.2.2.5]|uniref:HTH merR-type domain-containing protein n=1 Tax=Dictyobacter halimunensis TaxID=3026934 RepID=A0ABQ6FTL7_9CHLR|nr:hypothetical protein KDH_44530 [Dictyobacter sp. S3.2.2.5]
MDERNLQRIARHLKDEAAQRRVHHNIQRGRNEVTVTIGRASRLFGFSESQLRDWEKMGLIKPIRPREDTESRQITGQRQYSFAELDKLAIIRELLDEAHLTPGAIPPNINEIWSALALPASALSAQIFEQEADNQSAAIATPSPDDNINKRVTLAYRDLTAWRFYASRVLWLALLLVYENIPGFYAGLVLPAQDYQADEILRDPANISMVGPSLVGWLGQTGSFFTFLTPTPSFEYPSDYIVLPLCPPRLAYAITRLDRLSDPGGGAARRDTACTATGKGHPHGAAPA